MKSLDSIILKYSLQIPFLIIKSFFIFFAQLNNLSKLKQIYNLSKHFSFNSGMKNIQYISNSQ